jgi:ABC-type sulfate transport system permease component
MNALLQGDHASAPTSFQALIIALTLAYLFGQLIAWVYVFTHSGVSYSRSFVVSLIVLPVLVALVLIVVYNEIIHQGASLANHGVASPWVTMWLPCLLLALFAAWRYIGTCFTLRNDPVSAAIDRVGEFFGNLRRSVVRRIGWGTPT